MRKDRDSVKTKGFENDLHIFSSTHILVFSIHVSSPMRGPASILVLGLT
jgi:hypothetical protein